jgi:SagB-type dehydrogenase family enzyme
LTALEYHVRTNHTPESLRRSARPLDFANRPHPFKEYVGLDAVPLPEPAPPPRVAALAALAGASGPPQPLDLPQLSRLLRYGAGVMKTVRYPGALVYHFRAYSSAGALYPVELYAALPDGLHHFHPLEHALRRLREEDMRAALAEAAVAPDAARAGALLVLSGILWRTGWKYGERGYRHLYWDGGTMLANLLALAGSAGLRPRLLTGFVDSRVNEILGVEGEREAALALLVRSESGPARAATLEQAHHEVAPLSRRELDFPAAGELHRASSFESAEEVTAYRREQPVAPPPTDADSEPLELVIARRVSARDFSGEPIPQETLARILAIAAAPIPADAEPTAETYLIVNAVEGLERGAYRFEPPDRFELLHAGDFRALATHLCLDQVFAGLAPATVFWLTDLEEVVGGLDERGYRWAQLEGGIRAGRVQIAAFACGLGAVGSTFFDEEVSRLLCPTKSPLLCAAIGLRRKP